MRLNKSRVIYNDSTHSYTLDGVALSGITPLIKNQLFPDKYKEVPKYILDKAAERGTSIHEVCEICDDLGVTHDSDEARGYEKLKSLFGLRYECSEYLVSDEEHFASKIDKVYSESNTEVTLGDIKTTYQLDKEYVQWQLSIYAYLFEKQNPHLKVVRLAAIWLRGTTHEFVEVERIPNETIIELLKCEVEGRQFVSPVKETVPSIPEKYVQMVDAIKHITEQKSYWEKEEKKLKDELMKEMVYAGAYSWGCEGMTFTRKKESIRKSFDKEKFDKDYPGVYDMYIKESPVAGSVTIKFK